MRDVLDELCYICCMKEKLTLLVFLDKYLELLEISKFRKFIQKSSMAFSKILKLTPVKNKFNAWKNVNKWNAWKNVH